MSISYKKIFTILSLIAWILMILFGFYLDKKETNYDEIFIKRIIVDKMNISDSFYFSYPNPVNKKTPRKHVILENKYNEYLIDNDFRSIVFSSESILNMFKNAKKTDKSVAIFSLNNEQFQCAMGRDFVLTPNKIDKQEVITIFSKNKKYLDYCHKYFFDAVSIHIRENLEKFLLLSKDINKVFTKSEIVKYKYIPIINENLRKKQIEYTNKMIIFFQDTYKKDYAIIHNIESRIFLLNYKFSIFFIFFPIYILLYNTFLSNLRKETI